MQEVERLCDRVVVVARGRDVATGTVDELRELTGESDFEEAFVRLAFGPSLDLLVRGAAPSPASADGHEEGRP
jgi:sodium transport system ATP-binding protein